MSKNQVAGVSIFFLPVLVALTLSSVFLQGQSKPLVMHDVRRGVSPPLRDIPPVAPRGTMKPGQADNPIHHKSPLSQPTRLARAADVSIQSTTLPQVSANFGPNFEGIGDGVYGFILSSAPPDTNGAVGATQYVQTVNASFAVFDKNTGNLLFGAADISTLFTTLGGPCAVAVESDPIVVYDKQANRWLISIINASAPNAFSECIAVSTSSDATGSYNMYEVPFGSILPDYPKFGVWPDAYYFTADEFGPNGFVGEGACAFDRAAMLAGQALTSVCFTNPNLFAMMPSDLDGTTPPPAAEPNFYIGLGSTLTGDNTSLQLFKFHVDFATPANSTFAGPTILSVTTYSPLCSTTDAGNCVPQSQSAQKLDSLNFTPMFRLAYRNFGTHESLVVNHSVDAGLSGGVRWYEIQDPNGIPTVFQQGTFAPDSSWRWMGSVAMDSAGDIAAGYSESSSIMHPAIAVTGRTPSDALGTLESEIVVFDGSGSQTPSLNRWGDYSAITVDPVDDCTFWFTSEYIPTNGNFNWHTRIVSFKMNNCTSPITTPDFSLSSSPSTLNITPGTSGISTITVTPENGFNGTTKLSVAVTGSPAGVTASISPTSLTGSGSATLTVSTTNATPGGNFAVVATGTSGNLTHTAYVTIALPGFALASTPSNVFVNQNSTASTMIVIQKLNGFHNPVTFSATGLPPGVVAAFTPINSGRSRLNCSATAMAKTGFASVTVTGTSGNLTQTVVINLAVSAATGTGGVGTPAGLASAYNLTGIYTNGTTYSTGGLDGVGFSYSANLLTPSRILDGIQFKFGPPNHPNAINGTGQSIALPTGQFSELVILATGVEGAQTAQTLTVTYTDGSTSQFTRSFSDWFIPQNFPHEFEAVAMPYRNFADGSRDNRTFNLYAYPTPLNKTKTVESLTLPNNVNLVVLAITLE